jgi:integrase
MHRPRTRVYLITRTRTLPSGKRSRNWLLRWHDSAGRPLHQSLGSCDKVTKAVAKRLRAEKEDAIAGGRLPRDRESEQTLAEFVAADRAELALTRRGATLVEYDLMLAKLRAVTGDTIKLSAIARQHIIAVQARMLAGDTPAKPATIHKTLRGLKTIFNRAVARGYLYRNPVAGVAVPRVEPREQRVYTAAEVDRLLAAAPDIWWQALIRLAATSGLRRDELLNLRWRDVDFDRAAVSVVARDAGEVEIDGRRYRTWPWAAKARTSYRTVPLPPETIESLRRLRLRMGPTPYVFVDTQRLATIQRRLDGAGRLPVKTEIINNLLTRFKALQAAAARNADGTTVDWPIGSFHDLRRTFCTRLAEAGVPLHVLKRYAGHSDISTTERYYLGVGAEMDDRARRVFSAAAAAG